MFLYRRFVPGLAIYSYLIGDETTKEAAVIDPVRDVDEYLKVAQRQGLHLHHVLETHVHADYLCGSQELKARLGDQLTIHSSGLGGPDWTPAYADHVVHDGDEVRLGTIRLQAIHTPGHTPEHIAWALYDESRSKDEPWLLFTGDLLFVGDVGRPDLLGAEAREQLAHQLYDTLFERLAQFPDFTEVLPAHGAGSLCGKAIGSRESSTIGYERRFNHSLVEKPQHEWVEDLLHEMPLAPSYFPRMKKLNQQGPAVLGGELPGKSRLSIDQVYEQSCRDCVTLDVRSKEAFAAAHLPGAINIPYDANLATWAGWVLPYDRPIQIVTDDPNLVPQVVRQLIRVGLDHIVGYMEGGMNSWAQAGYPLATLETLSVHQLHDRRDEIPGALTVLDVRTDREWNSGHIDGAFHIHGGKLPEQLDRVPRDKPVAVVCGTGYRASIAASLLKRAGYEQVANVFGGMTAWRSAQLPLVTDHREPVATH